MFILSMVVCFGCEVLAYSEISHQYVSMDRSGNWQRSLNGKWRFMLNGTEGKFFTPDFDDSDWEEIPVPGNWEMYGFEEPYYKEPSNSIGLYRKRFTVPESWNERHVFIRFEGVLFAYELWVNGSLVGSFESPFNRSEFDITPFIKWTGDNILAVRVYKKYKGYEFDTMGWWALSGIYRDVSLLAVPDIHLKELIVVTDVEEDLSKSSVWFKIKVGRFEKVRSPVNVDISGRLYGPKGDIIDKFTASALLKGWTYRS
ncbi:MAG: sugar-binding domain-containing protein [Bacteroidales bacterium]